MPVLRARAHPRGSSRPGCCVPSPRSALRSPARATQPVAGACLRTRQRRLTASLAWFLRPLRGTRLTTAAGKGPQRWQLHALHPGRLPVADHRVLVPVTHRSSRNDACSRRNSEPGCCLSLENWKCRPALPILPRRRGVEIIPSPLLPRCGPATPPSTDTCPAGLQVVIGTWAAVSPASRQARNRRRLSPVRWGGP